MEEFSGQGPATAGLMSVSAATGALGFILAPWSLLHFTLADT